MSSRRGFSMVEALVAIAVVGTFAGAVMRASRTNASNTVALENKGQLRGIRSYVRAFLSCGATFDASPAACNSGGAIDVLQEDKQVLVSSTGTTLGNFLLTNRCNGQNLQFFATDQAAKNPRPVDLFHGIPIRCPDAMPCTNPNPICCSNPDDPSCHPAPTALGCYTLKDFVLDETTAQLELSRFKAGQLPADGITPEVVNSPQWYNGTGDGFEKTLKNRHKNRYGSFPITRCARSHPENCGIPTYGAFVYNGRYLTTGFQIIGNTSGPTPAGATSPIPQWNVKVDYSATTGMVYVGTHKTARDKGSFTTIVDTTQYSTTTDSSGKTTTSLPLAEVWPHVLDGHHTLTVSPMVADPTDPTKAIIDPASQGATATDPICKLTFQTISPLVLDLGGRDALRILSYFDSYVRFDLLGDGFRRRTGWVAPSAAFLALDLNGNGVIDNGRELFGEGTLLDDGAPAPNGFAALAQYDVGDKGYVDKTDPIFSKLLLWEDRNQDGRVQRGELRSVLSAGIERISTRYQTVPLTAQERAGAGGATVRLRSKFYGPEACGTTGCSIYDVYFHTREARVAYGK